MANRASSGTTIRGGIANVWILRIGMVLTTSSETPIIQIDTAISEVHQPSPNCILAASGPIAPMAPAGAGMPVKNCFSYSGWSPDSIAL